MAKKMRNDDGIASSQVHNVLAVGTNIKGDIHAEENFRVDGSIEGTITCKGKIVIGTQSVVSGNIECANIEVMGTINGNVKCTDTLVLRSTARVMGDIAVQVLQIEPGAQFDGSSAMLQSFKETK